MTGPLVTIGHDATVADAWSIIRSRQVRHLPVLDSDRRLIGMVTDHDLRLVILERCLRPDAVPAETVDLIGFGTASDGVPAWVTDHPLQIRSPQPIGTTSKQWTASFFVRPGETYRLRVREVEFIPNATDRTGARLQTGTPGEITERTVFTDIVPLPVL